MRPRLRLAVHDEQAGFVARIGGELRDQFIGKIKIKFVGPHTLPLGRLLRENASV